MIKVDKIRYKINLFGSNTKLTNLYIDLHKFNTLEIKVIKLDLEKQISTATDNRHFGFRIIESAKSLNLWFGEENITQQEVLDILSDFITSTNFSLLYINNQRESVRFLASVFIKYIDVEGAYLENI